MGCIGLLEDHAHGDDPGTAGHQHEAGHAPGEHHDDTDTGHEHHHD
jgi:hypothetical protein